MGGFAGRIGLALSPAILAATVPALAQGVPQDVTPATPTETPQPAAEPGRASGRRIYDAAYFKTYAPTTALEIVQHVPGFSLETVDPSVRGFGGAAGNLVINGQRPSSKSDTIDTILARIPASRVLRVEVAAGDLFGAEFTGKSQVLNLITTATGGLATTIEGGVRRDFTGKLYPEGSVSALLRHDKSTFNVSITVKNEQTSEEGFDRVTTLPGGAQTEYRRKLNRIADPNAAVAASWEYAGGTNRTAHLNVRAAIDRFSLTQTNAVTPIDEPSRNDFLTQRYHLDEYEFGGDVTRPFAGGGLKLIGLATRRYRDYRDVSLIAIDDPVPARDRQTLDDTLEETLARLVWTRSFGGWNVEDRWRRRDQPARQQGRSVLAAIRRRGDANRSADRSGGGTRSSWRSVRQRRARTVAEAARRSRLTYEASRLTVRGDTEAERTLKFLKPKVNLDWRPGKKWHAQLSIQRTVAQLQFEDFISSAELANDRVNGGNANLLPQRAWETLVTLERPILGDGLVRLEAGYNAISLVQDRVPTPEGFDVPGNLGSGSVYILRGRIEAPLKSLGIRAGG